MYPFHTSSSFRKFASPSGLSRPGNSYLATNVAFPPIPVSLSPSPTLILSISLTLSCALLHRICPFSFIFTPSPLSSDTRSICPELLHLVYYASPFFLHGVNRTSGRVSSERYLLAYVCTYVTRLKFILTVTSLKTCLKRDTQDWTLDKSFSLGSRLQIINVTILFINGCNFKLITYEIYPIFLFRVASKFFHLNYDLRDIYICNRDSTGKLSSNSESVSISLEKFQVIIINTWIFYEFQVTTINTDLTCSWNISLTRIWEADVIVVTNVCRKYEWIKSLIKEIATLINHFSLWGEQS